MANGSGKLAQMHLHVIVVNRRCVNLTDAGAAMNHHQEGWKMIAMPRHHVDSKMIVLESLHGARHLVSIIEKCNRLNRLLQHIRK